MSNVAFTVSFTLIECCKCAMHFAVPNDWDNNRRADNMVFYCPNGHDQHYRPGVSEVAKLRQEKERSERDLQAKLNEANHARLVAEKAQKKAVRDKRKVELRIAHGVCPCCNKTFADIANHMVTEHKDFRLPGGKEQKRLTA